MKNRADAPVQRYISPVLVGSVLNVGESVEDGAYDVPLFCFKMWAYPQFKQALPCGKGLLCLQFSFWGALITLRSQQHGFHESG